MVRISDSEKLLLWFWAALVPAEVVAVPLVVGGCGGGTDKLELDSEREPGTDLVTLSAVLCFEEESCTV